eukprot:684584-Rhodomonas_salina.2
MPRATAFYGVLLCTALSLLVCCSAYGDSKGIINLDHLTFDKIIGEDRPVVVAFTDVQPVRYDSSLRWQEPRFLWSMIP